jgi:hypothetical protein
MRKLGQRLYGGIMGGIVLIGTIADLPAQFLIWRGWFTWLAPYLHTLKFRWFLGIVGILISLSPWIWEWINSVKVNIRGVDGPNKDARLVVTNLRVGRKFSVECEIVAQRNIPNDMPNNHFPLKWANNKDKLSLLTKDQSAEIVVATWDISYKSPFFACMSIAEWADSPVETYSCLVKSQEHIAWASWFPESPDALPEFDLRITVVGEDASRAFIKGFTLRPKTPRGPLELIPISLKEVKA